MMHLPFFCKQHNIHTATSSATRLYAPVSHRFNTDNQVSRKVHYVITATSRRENSSCYKQKEGGPFHASSGVVILLFRNCGEVKRREELHSKAEEEEDEETTVVIYYTTSPPYSTKGKSQRKRGRSRKTRYILYSNYGITSPLKRAANNPTQPNPTIESRVSANSLLLLLHCLLLINCTVR
jgi:hypothetical protein